MNLIFENLEVSNKDNNCRDITECKNNCKKMLINLIT